MVFFCRVSGGYNPADILSKTWSYTKIWRILQPLIFWVGDTNDFLELELKRYGGPKKGGDRNQEGFPTFGFFLPIL